MSYRFRLQPVLNVRKKKEDAVRQELARAQTLYRDEKQVVDGLSETRLQSVEGLRTLRDSQVGRELDVWEAVLYQDYLSRLDNEIVIRREVLENIAAEVEQARDRVVQARKSRRILERLKERLYAEYIAESSRLEQKALDEIGQIRHSRARHSPFPGKR